MNKKDLIDEIAARTSMKKTAVDDVLVALRDIAQAHLVSQGAELPLPGIGKLKAVAKAARTARNPRTGEEVQIPAHTAIKLVVAKELKDALA